MQKSKHFGPQIFSITDVCSMLKVSPAHVGGYLGPKTSKKGSFFYRFHLDKSGLAEIHKKLFEMVSFLTNLTS